MKSRVIFALVLVCCAGCGTNPAQPLGRKAQPVGSYAGDSQPCGNIHPQLVVPDPTEPQVGGAGRLHDKCIRAAEYYLREETRREGIRYASERKVCDTQPYQPIEQCQSRTRQDHEQRLLWVNCAYVQMIKDCR